MRTSQLMLGLILAIVACIASANEPTLKEKIQGTWSRPNGQARFIIKGDTYTEFRSNAPFNVHTTGRLSYPQGKDYAVATLANKWTVWIFSAGKSAIAIEVWNPDGELGGKGEIYYKDPEP